MLSDFYYTIKPELIAIIMTIFTAVLTYLGSEIKRIYESKTTEEKKRSTVKTVVHAIEQLHADLPGEEKLQKAKDNICILLEESNIQCSELEIELLIEEELNLSKKVSP